MQHAGPAAFGSCRPGLVSEVWMWNADSGFDFRDALQARRSVNQALCRRARHPVRTGKTHGSSRGGNGLARIAAGKMRLSEFQPEVGISRIDANCALNV